MPQLAQIIPSEFLLFSAFQKLLKITVIIIAGIITNKLSKIALNKWEAKQKDQPSRAKTITNLAKNTVKIVIDFILILLIAHEVGINIIPLLTGAGIIGLAIGMGAKDVAADLIAGFFILFENRFNVGEKIEAASIKGRVTDISLRTITIKDEDGNLHIIPNSSISTIKKFK